MMKFALHNLSKESIPFNMYEYSKFKYGSKTIARKFGYELAENFILPSRIGGRQIVVSPSPYNFIPTATFAMKDYFVARFNELNMYTLKPLQETKTFRPHSYNEDYGEMGVDQRRKAISSESFHIDREFLKDKFLIFMDDIRITGAHEERIKEMCWRLKLDEVCDYMFLYFAEADDSVEPQIENMLNHAYVSTLVDVNNIIANEEFIFNTRVTKFILANDINEFDLFLTFQSKTFRHTLLHYAIGNGYHLQDEFKENISILKRML